MRVNHEERLRRSKELEVSHNCRRAYQIETMIAEFDRMCVDLGHEIAAAEMRAKISDPAHFAYPPYAKAARDRRARLEQSAQALKAELNRLRYEAAEADQRQLAA